MLLLDPGEYPLRECAELMHDARRRLDHERDVRVLDSLPTPTARSTTATRRCHHVEPLQGADRRRQHIHQLLLGTTATDRESFMKCA